MHSKICITLFFLIVTSALKQIEGYKILGLFPFIAHSHMTVFKSIMKELARRGHVVHVVSHYPLDKPMENYVDMSLAGSISSISNKINIGVPKEDFDFLPLNQLNIFLKTLHNGNKVMQAESIRNLLNSTETYDLIITESFLIDSTLGFVHKFNAPFIYLSSCSTFPWSSLLVANPQNPAYIPSLLSSHSSRMTFWERVRNTLNLATVLLFWRVRFVPANERYMRELFGEDVPPISDLAYKASLILVNSHYSIHGARPVVPGVIDVAGVHVTEPMKLPQDIEEFINSSPNGTIYFSMGSILRGASFSEAHRNAFLGAFSKLRERVLWKFEEKNISGLPNNVLIKGWMPQRDILAHPKVKLCILHGGLLSIIEALHESKPIIGIPIFADQMVNLRSLEAEEMALYLPYESISEETVLQAIHEGLKPKYAENAKRLSNLYHDRPLKPLDMSVYWIEHVIKQNGNPRLRSPAVNMPYYQYLLVDIMAFISFVILATVFIFTYSSIKCYRLLKKLFLRK